ncbi:hypothetical protein L1987_11523 [Smallanthus sonchifolius]|uniref:Uncharacterized protein n=1 Tax=Smallanthus sonchifolius TaxID=185202 RepID=A0ACB9JBR3_9ASTR|nr:hypothetical protein L1987_11523 [Smallanthus sonchifolius]
MSRMYQGFSCKLTNHFRHVCGTFSLLTSDTLVVYLFVKQFLITPKLWNRFTFTQNLVALLVCYVECLCAWHIMII